jgi:hypothetical protein
VLGLLLAAGFPLKSIAEAQPLLQVQRPTVLALQHYLYFHSRGDAGAELRSEPALQDPRFAGAQVV